MDVGLEAATGRRESSLDEVFVVAGPPDGLNSEKMLSKARKILGAYEKIAGPVFIETKAGFFNSIDLLF
ncbi:MAG: hypothetical protein L0Y50_09440 [Beijerinckiaceae bacterium]|nr:hypothetical protein [Beijerinckiaceae bacterium]